MKFAASVSEADNLAALSRDLIDGLSGSMEGAPDLAVLFFTAPVTPVARQLAADLRGALKPGTMIGVSGESVVGGDREIERRPGASLLVGSLPGVVLRPFHIGASEWPGLLADDERLQNRVGAGEDHRGHLLLADPFTTPVDKLLPRLDETFRRPTFGGMASAAQAPGANVLLLDDDFHTDGAVGLGFGGPLRLDLVVSQGCRPIGDPLIVTRAEGGLVAELGRRHALEVAQEMLEALPPAELELVQSAGLFVGVAINEYKERFVRGDFLVRGLMGVDRDGGALAIGDHVRAGQTIQFHVRDSHTAHEDLCELLEPQRSQDPPAGALLFSCNGRGSRMFSEPDHDARTTRGLLEGLPLAGFFAMGELGPVGGRSFIHGHTASLALFRPE